MLSISSLLPKASIPSTPHASPHTQQQKSPFSGRYGEEAIEEQDPPWTDREDDEDERREAILGERSLYHEGRDDERRFSFLNTSRRDEEATRETDIPSVPSSSSASFQEGMDRELLLFLTTQGTQPSNESPSSSLSSPYRSNLHWGCLNASEISGPAAIAVGLAFLDSENEEARQGLRIPNDLDQLLDILPHVLMCKVRSV